MASIVEIVKTLDEIVALFPCDEEGQNMEASPEAQALAAEHLTSGEPISWHLPNCFDTRYGSSYIATARQGDKSVRFLQEEGTYREGDDIWFSL